MLQNFDVKQDGPPDVGSRVDVMWLDNVIYNGTFKGVNSMSYYVVRLSLLLWSCGTVQWNVMDGPCWVVPCIQNGARSIVESAPNMPSSGCRVSAGEDFVAFVESTAETASSVVSRFACLT